ncbi:hypothetical protein [Gordonia malaquae]|uniref:hypothetical protein n=1 Tax=Gordonia malaquae TaxID=410332 RepID=UPI0030187EBC
MNTMKIADTGAQDAVSAAVGALSGQTALAHNAVHAITSAIFPPTNDSASAQAVAQQQVNTQEFSAALNLGLDQMAKVAALVSVNNVKNLAIDAAGAATIGAVAV